MDEHAEPQRSGTTSAEAQPAEADTTPAAPVLRLLANPRRVRRT